MAAGRRLRPGGPDEVIQPGTVTGWGVRLARLGADVADPEAFVAQIAGSVLAADRTGLRWSVGSDAYELPRRGAFVVTGRARPEPEVRWAGPAGTVPRFADRLRLSLDGHRLELDLARGRRLVDSTAPAN